MAITNSTSISAAHHMKFILVMAHLVLATYVVTVLYVYSFVARAHTGSAADWLLSSV